MVKGKTGVSGDGLVRPAQSEKKDARIITIAKPLAPLPPVLPVPPPPIEEYSPPQRDVPKFEPVQPEPYSPPQRDVPKFEDVPKFDNTALISKLDTDVKALKKIGDFVSDVGKTIAYGVAAPVNSVTGHKYKPEYETKVGAVLGQGSNVGHDSLHILGKSFADTISGGAATKLANKLRKDENKEAPYAYNEMKNAKAVKTGVPFIDKNFGTFEKVSKGGALVIGSLAGAKALGSGAQSIAGKVKTPEQLGDNTGGTKAEVSTLGAAGIAVGILGAALLLR